jgi:hypothetical protein
MDYYLTLDYLPDLDRPTMEKAGHLILRPLSPNPDGWENGVTVSGFDQYALLHDVYQFEAKAGARYEVWSTSYDKPTLLRIYDNLGNTLILDDGLKLEPSEVINGVFYYREAIHDWVAPYTGTYYVQAGWNQGTSHPYYSLSVSEDAHTTFPTTKLVPDLPSVDEGTAASFTISSTSIRPGTVLNYTISGVSEWDLGYAQISGTVTINQYGKGNINVSVIPDHTTEGPETMVLKLGDGAGTILGTASLVINDTSRAFNFIRGSESGELLVGTNDDDQLEAFGGNDVLQGGRGNDALSGGSGNDVAKYAGNWANFKIERTDNGWKVSDKTGAEGIDSLQSIETIRFADMSVALDLGGSAGQAYRIYQAAFNRAADPAGLGFWMNYLDKGGSVQGMAAGFIDSNEFRSLYGITPTNAELVGRMYQNVLHRAPDQAGFDYWVGALDKHLSSVSEVLAGFSESAENQAALLGVVGTGIAYVPYG